MLLLPYTYKVLTASLHLQGRQPLDLLSAQLAAVREVAAGALAAEAAASAAALGPAGPFDEDHTPEAEAAPPVHEVLSWGHGANYQLGTGATGAQVCPARCASGRLGGGSVTYSEV